MSNMTDIEHAIEILKAEGHGSYAKAVEALVKSKADQIMLQETDKLRELENEINSHLEMRDVALQRIEALERKLSASRESGQLHHIAGLERSLEKRKDEAERLHRHINDQRQSQVRQHGVMKAQIIDALGSEYEPSATQDVWATALEHVRRVVQDRQTWNQHRDTYVTEIGNMKATRNAIADELGISGQLGHSRIHIINAIRSLKDQCERLVNHQNEHRDDFNDLLRLTGLKTSDGITYGRALTILRREIEQLAAQRAAYIAHMKGHDCPSGCGDERWLVCVNPACPEDRDQLDARLSRLVNSLPGDGVGEKVKYLEGLVLDSDLKTAMRGAGVTLPPPGDAVVCSFDFDPNTPDGQGLTVVREFRTREDGSVIESNKFEEVCKVAAPSAWKHIFQPWFHGTHEQRVSKSEYYSGAVLTTHYSTDGDSITLVSDKEGDTVRVEKYANYVDGAISISRPDDDDGDVRCTFPIHMAADVADAIQHLIKKETT